MTLTITDLDPNSSTAQFIGSIGVAVVRFAVDANQMTFIEQTPFGSPTLLSVYAPPTPGEPLPAVYSRHIFTSPANIAISQYAGSCKPKR